VTGPEWQTELVRLAMEAVERSVESLSCSEASDLRAAMNERMAQAAQAIVIEIDEARGGERARLDRIDAAAREVFRVLMKQPSDARIDTSALSRAYGQAAYVCAEKLEEARAAWLAKRGQR
jgi:hypothetical protein